jgi:hypothetical protein
VYSNALVVRPFQRISSYENSFNLNSTVQGRFDIGRYALNMQFPINVPILSLFEDGQVTIGTVARSMSSKLKVESTTSLRTARAQAGVQLTGTGVSGSSGDWDYGVYAEANGYLNYSYALVGTAETGSGIAVGVFGKARAYNGGVSYAGYFNGNVAYTGTLSRASDAKLKEEIRSISNGLELVLKLKPVEYKYKQITDASFTKTKQAGFIAQEVFSILPHVVTNEQFALLNTEESADKSYLGIDYISLIPYLVSAIQEQQKLIKKLLNQSTENNKESTDFVDNYFTVYPNPGINEVVIEIQEDLPKTKLIKIYNESGVIVSDLEVKTSSLVLNTTGWKKGTYYVCLMLSNIPVETKRLLLKN